MYEELQDIADYPNWLEITPIELGRSGENKYHIIRNNGIQFILRTSSSKNYKRHCESAKFAGFIHETLGLNMNIPVEVAACNSDKLAYTIYTWVEGVDADRKILNAHTPEQVKFGEKAGRLLKTIHSVTAPADILPWDEFYNPRLDTILKRFAETRITFRGSEETVEFLKNNRHLLKDRPQTALHGDFRSGNLIFDAEGEYGVIDFDRWCWGDPYMDFKCIRRSCSTAFARGQINGYFEGSIPRDFFPLMGFYTAAEIIISICEAYPISRNAIDEAVRYAERTAREYDNFGGLVPAWY